MYSGVPRIVPNRVSGWEPAGLALGMAVKVPLWPLHSWLVDLNEQNHPSGAADVLGTLYKVGGYGFFAWAIPVLPLGAERLAPLFIALGAFTAVYGAVVATSRFAVSRTAGSGSLLSMRSVGSAEEPRACASASMAAMRKLTGLVRFPPHAPP